MPEKARALVPRTPAGWVAVALALAVFIVIWVMLVLGGSMTNGGETALPIWMRLVTFGAILLVAIPAVVLGRRARQVDPSTLGTVALVISAVLAVWFALTGVLSMFFE